MAKEKPTPANAKDDFKSTHITGGTKLPEQSGAQNTPTEAATAADAKAAPPDVVPPINEQALTEVGPPTVPPPVGEADANANPGAPPRSPGFAGPIRPSSVGAARDRNMGPVPPGGLDDEIDLDFASPPLPPARSSLASLMGASDELSVADLFQKFRDVVDGIKNRDVSAVWKSGGAVLLVFADLMDRGAFDFTTLPVVGIQSGAHPIDKLGLELAACRNDLSGLVTSGRAVNWAGGEPHPMSGAPMAMGAPVGSGDAKIDPGTVLIIYELVMKVWEAIQKRRNR